MIVSSVIFSNRSFSVVFRLLMALLRQHDVALFVFVVLLPLSPPRLRHPFFPPRFSLFCRLSYLMGGIFSSYHYCSHYRNCCASKLCVFQVLRFRVRMLCARVLQFRFLLVLAVTRKTKRRSSPRIATPRPPPWSIQAQSLRNWQPMSSSCRSGNEDISLKHFRHGGAMSLTCSWLVDLFVFVRCRVSWRSKKTSRLTPEIL